MKHVFFSAGEPSGDLHAAAVLRKVSGYRLTGIGGDGMIAAGLSPLKHMWELSVLGFWEVFQEYARLRRIFNDTCFFLQREKVDLLVLVDFPGFNLRLAAYARSLGIPVLYYIAPKAWAWGEARVKAMARNISRLAVLFPFEEAWFGARGLRAEFVGHPLMEARPLVPTKPQVLGGLGLPAGTRLLGLFPGSRLQEVGRMMGPMVEAAEILIRRGAIDAAAVARAPGIPAEALRPASGVKNISIYSGDPRALQAAADFLIVKSGTANLETALAGTPFVAVYKTSPVTYFIGRRVVRVPFLNPVNLLCGEAVVPELLQNAASPEAMAKAAWEILESPERQSSMRRAFNELKNQLGGKSASAEVARMIGEMLHG